MQLYIVMAGKAKDRMKPIMIDELHKCENYVKARKSSPTKVKWFDIVPASQRCPALAESKFHVKNVAGL